MKKTDRQNTTPPAAAPAGEPPAIPLAVPAEKKATLTEWIAITLMFALPVVLFIWPVLRRFSSVALGLDDDNVLNLWTFWHASRAFLLQDEPLYSTLRILAPVGSSLALHDMSILPVLLLSPLTALWGLFGGFNLFLVLAQLWAGFATFKLVRLLTGSRLAAAFAAFFIELSPILYYRLINHYTLTWLGFIPFLIYLLLKGADGADTWTPRRRGLVTGGAAIACFLTSFNIFVLSFFTLGLIWVVLFAAALAGGSYALARRMAVVVAWTGLVCAAFFYLWAVVTPVQDARFWAQDVASRGGNETGALPAYFVLPNPRLWFFGSAAATPADGNLNPERFNNLGLSGAVLFALGLAFLARRRRAVMIALLIAAALCFDLALGYGSVNPLAAPDAGRLASPLLLFPKFLNLPLMKQARVPARWAFPLLALVATGAGCGCHWILEKIRRPRWRAATLAGLCAAVLIEFGHPATPTAPFTMPAAYEVIGTAERPTETIVEWPLFIFCGLKGFFGPPIDPARMVWATHHHYRIVTGYLSRIPVQRIAAVLNQPLLRDLWLLQDGEAGLLTDSGPTDPLTIRRWIALNDVKFIVLNKAVSCRKALQFLTGGGFASPVREDDQYIVLQTAMKN